MGGGAALSSGLKDLLSLLLPSVSRGSWGNWLPIPTFRLGSGVGEAGEEGRRNCAGSRRSLRLSVREKAKAEGVCPP